jgi:glycosyltransferase involved in cell wall biosynthesis
MTSMKKDHRPRIAYMVTPVTFGGCERVSMNYLRVADRERFDITPILFIRPWEDEPLFAAELRSMGYSFHSVPVGMTLTGDYLRFARAVRMVLAILRLHKMDLLHTHGYFADIAGCIASRITRLPHIATSHGFINTEKKLRLYNRIDCLALRFSERIIAVSEGIRHDLVHTGVRPERITVIPNTVGAGTPVNGNGRVRQLLGLGREETIAGYAGRLSVEKGLAYLLEAVSILKSRGEKFRLLILGDGPERGVLEEMTRMKGIADMVIFAGFQADVEEWLGSTDIFVLPSLTEGAPMALLEAMSLGLPVLATAVGGVPLMVEHGVNGLLAAPGDPQSLSEGLSLLLRDPPFRRKLGRAALDFTNAHCDIIGWRERIENEYASLLTSTSTVRKAATA